MTAAPVGHNGGPLIDTPARKRGSPSSYMPELADIICNRLVEAESLKTMCRDPGMPSERAVLRWSTHRPEFRRQYDIARELGQHLGAEGVLEIAAAPPLGAREQAPQHNLLSRALTSLM